MAAIKVIGIGDASRGDAAAGLMVARKLRTRYIPEVTVLEVPDDGIEVMNAWEHASVVFFIDAARTGALPGTIYRCDACEESPTQHHLYSTCGFGFSDALDLARSIGLSPQCPVLYAIEGDIYETDAALSPAVAEAVDEVVQNIESEIAEIRHGLEILSRVG